MKKTKLAKNRVEYRLGSDVDLKKTAVYDKNGRRITNKRAQKIAGEAIKRAVGRPSLTGVAKISPEVKARVPQKLKLQLDREAKRRGESVSTLVREALEKYLKSA